MCPAFLSEQDQAGNKQKVNSVNRQKTHRKDIVRQAKTLLKQGVYDPLELFEELYDLFPYAHYSVIREIVHKVKTHA